ncbi:IS3 family transposase [Paremcibacter congregatus]|uniref:HTH-like domain-containing protein n=1 Tax=Paremcibacter congregatus TaxID=2043170 RepID=A0A2G4YVN3_9PROT|nr:IS3 family transposase [Paremcibacter congregatus]PHZ86387.1 hypothetical protein CRD36_00400 [Paremcibacter congregatus]QDE28516.1 IS3 family transposase [Paremcibacter congregatus]
MKYAWIYEQKSRYPISILCRFMGVSRSSYYSWREAPISLRARQDESLTEDIKHIFKESRQTYGTRRIKEKRASENNFVGRKRIGR